MGRHRTGGRVIGTGLGRAGLVVGALLVLLVGYVGIRALIAYGDLQRVPFEDVAAAADVLATLPDEVVDELRAEEDTAEEVARSAEAEELDSELLAELRAERGDQVLGGEESFRFVSSPPLPDAMFDAFLLVGVEGTYRADAIIYTLFPTDGSRPLMVSLPRDLYLPNPCTHRYTRINAGLGGCKGYASGAELLSLMVADFTGIEVDHFARIDFSGFQRVIDALGGIQICFDHSVRDSKSGLSLPAGCTNATGAQALAWVRSRSTEELVDGEWQRAAGVSDFTRQAKEREMLFKVAAKLNSFSSFASFAGVAEGLADTVALDSGFTFGDAVSLAWSLRGLSADRVTQLRVEVDGYVTSAGAYVLVPNRSFNELLAGVYPAAAR